jgi:hypothetical protein
MYTATESTAASRAQMDCNSTSGLAANVTILLKSFHMIKRLFSMSTVIGPMQQSMDAKVLFLGQFQG